MNARHIHIGLNLLLAMLLPSTPAAAQEVPAPPPQPTDQNESDRALAPERMLVNEAMSLLQQRQFEHAIAKSDEAIAAYRQHAADKKRRIYSARSLPETLLYTAEASRQGISADVLDLGYGYAWYVRAYALIELDRSDEALVALGEAIVLAPMNSQFQSELGNLHQERKDWTAAMAAYKAAQTASEFSPDELKRHDLGRALRGQGFVLIETGELDQAEAMYRKALELNPDDGSARHELEYIRQMRTAAPATH
jgi:tetratricopeptide (TPR) repeat protein